MRLAFLILLSLSGCQCFVPVAEIDAGPTDAGVVVPECTTAAQCAARDGGFSGFCSSAAMSCLNGQCVLECQGGRTCNTNGACVQCQPPQTPVSLCRACDVRTAACGFRVIDDDCPGTRFTTDSSWLFRSPDGGCEFFELIPADGGAVAGTAFGTTEEFNRFANIPELGGSCSIQSLFTGAPRLAVQCPRCSFAGLGCD